MAKITTPAYVVYLLEPLRKGIPEEVRSLKAPGLVAKLRQARHALLLVDRPQPDKRWKSRLLAQAAILGPNGLVGYSGHLASERRQSDAFAIRALTRTDAFSVLRLLSRSELKNAGDPEERAAQTAARALAARFLRRLDRRVLSALKLARALNHETYNWVKLSPVRRIAALRSYPWFAERMVDSGFVAATIDIGGGSLEEAMMEELNCSRRDLRRTARVPACLWRHIERRSSALYHSRDVLPLLARTPDHLLPRTRKQWVAWARAWGMVRSIAVSLDQSVENALLADTLARPLSDIDAIIAGADVRGTIRSVNDMVRALADNVLIPASIGTGRGSRRQIESAARSNRATHEKVVAALYPILAGNGGLKPLLQISAEWHKRGDRGQRMSRRERDELPDNAAMARLIDEPVTIDGLTYRPLLTAGALRAEAKAMRNCLDYYTDRAICGDIFVFHVNGTRNGEPFSASMTLRPTRSADRAGRFEVDDIREYGDARSDRAVAETLADLVNKRKLEARIDPEWHKTYQKTRGVYGMFECPEIAVERAVSSWESWVFLLPKRLRTDTVWEALEGPFFEVGRLLCLKSWMTEKRQARAKSVRAQRRTQQQAQQRRAA